MHDHFNSQTSTKIQVLSKENNQPSNTSSNIQNDQFNGLINLLPDGTFEIDLRLLTFIFRFSYASLKRVRLARAPGIPPIAHDIFYYIREKLVFRRYTDHGRFANRMKYEEKVKFVMRAFDHSLSLTNNATLSSKNQHYNKQSQIDFFSRADVKAHFLQEIHKALLRKKAENERRIVQLQRFIESAIRLGTTHPQQSYQLFRDKVQRRQLPWTDNMFMDILQFSRLLYVKYANPSPAQQRRILGLQIGENGEWQMLDIPQDVQNELSVKKEHQDMISEKQQYEDEIQGQDTI